LSVDLIKEQKKMKRFDLAGKKKIILNWNKTSHSNKHSNTYTHRERNKKKKNVLQKERKWN
jgi:hypothetical protein